MPARPTVILLSGILLVVEVTGAAGQGFPGRAAQELGALSRGVTVATWLAAHGADGFIPFGRDSIRENDQRWCARASRAEALADGTRMVRYAYFYPPPPEAAFVLPPAPSTALVREHCVLGTVWIETAAPDSAAGSALAARVRDAFARVYGPVTAGPDVFSGLVPVDSQRRALSRLPGSEALLLGLHFFGAGAWRTPGRWQADSQVIVTAYDGGFGRRREGRVLAFAFLPIAALGSYRSVAEETVWEERRSRALTATAARLAGLDSAKTTRLLATLAGAESAFVGRSGVDAKAVDVRAVAVLRDWITSARALPPSGRAAALLAADEAVGSEAMVYVRAQRQDSARAQLEHLGAIFTHDELGASENYTHNWLDEALRLDPQGPIGRLATLAQMRRGFNETGMCGGGPEPFRRVIVVGQQLLGRSLAASTQAEVHRLVGDAFADIVALAAGAGGEYADSSAYVAEAGAARDSAIAHYRRGLALDARLPEARRVWLEAWRLLAGLPPLTTHFFCVYD